MPLPVVAVFDVGKTNKKLFLFNQSYEIVHEQSSHFDEVTDEDGDPCEDIDALKAFINDGLKRILAMPEFKVRAVNFSAYGASLVYLDADGKNIGPLYNYLKPYPPQLQKKFYDTYGGESLLAFETASPVLGSLNSGLQLYRIKYEDPDFYKRIQHALHLPQYLSYLVTGRPFSEITSIGCHTHLWHFQNMDYHHWTKKEGVAEKFPPVVPSDMVVGTLSSPHTVSVGVGLHDSSSALIPYLVSFPEPFALISTGTWAITLNPFNTLPLTRTELNCDCLCYLQYRGTPVKASRLFAGRFHEQQVERIAAHFGQNKEKYFSLPYDESFLSRIDTRFDANPAHPENVLKEVHFATRNLADFDSDVEAYYQLVFDLAAQQYISSSLVLNGPAVKRIFIDGGFGNNAIYMNLLASFFPEMEVFASSIPQATAIGAALAIHESWNTEAFPKQLIQLKRYSASQNERLRQLFEE